MTDIEMYNGSLTGYLFALIIVWAFFAAIFWMYLRVIWPLAVWLYWATAKRLYWALRNICAKDGYDGYKVHNNRIRKGWS